jgi:tetratricopeptide (TPR) repeat protein
MIEKDPDRRYPDAAAVVADLDGWLTGGRVSARRPSSVSRLARKAGSPKGRRLIAGAVILLVAGVLGGWLWVRGADERARAATEAARAHKAKQVEALLGTTELESPDPDRRLGDLDRALSLVPHWAPWLADRAVAQMELGLFDGALADCSAVAAQERAPASVRARAAMIAMLVHGLGRADAAAAAAVPAPEAAGSYGALARALRDAFAGSGASAKAALAAAGDDLAEGALPWERAIVAAVVAERGGDPAEALQQFVRSIRAKSKAPSFALGLHGMARAALARAAAGAATIPPGDTTPGAPLVLTEPDPHQRAFAALIEATRRVPSLAPARADLAALCTAVIDGTADASAVRAVGPERARLTRAQLALCEGRFQAAETDLLVVEAGTAADHVRVATALRGLAQWTLRDDPAGAKALLEPLSKLPAYSSHPAVEREPVYVASRAVALIADPAAPWPQGRNFITPFGRWASGWLKPLGTGGTGRLTELDHHLFGSAGQPGARAWPYLAVWPPALAAWAELRRAETRAWIAARPGGRANESDLADLAGADGARLSEIAVRELPALTAETAAAADPAALTERIAQARYAASLAARRRVTRARLTVALAVWPECAPLQAQLAALDAE